MFMQQIIRPAVPLTDAELERFGREHAGCKVERESDGSLVVSPVTTEGGGKNFELTVQLGRFVDVAGGKGFDSSVGFTLPDGAVLSPDASWISPERYASLTREALRSYARVVPDLWIELRSQSDRVAVLRSKLLRVRGFGAAYVVLIDPFARHAWSDGEPPQGFTLDLEAIYDA